MYYNIPTTINTVQNNFGYTWQFTCQDSAGAVVNLTNAALTFTAQLESDLNITFSNPMSIISAPAGTCQYTVLAADFPTPGVYQGQIVANYSSSTEIVTFAGITINVTAQLPT